MAHPSSASAFESARLGTPFKIKLRSFARIFLEEREQLFEPDLPWPRTLNAADVEKVSTLFIVQQLG